MTRSKITGLSAIQTAAHSILKRLRKHIEPLWIRPRFVEPLPPLPRPERRLDPVYQAERRRALNNPKYRPMKLDSEQWQLLRLDLMAADGIEVSPKQLRDAFEDVRQKLRAPEIVDKAEAIARAWLEPPAHAMWHRWRGPWNSARSVRSYEAAKAILIITGAYGQRYLKAAHGELQSNPTVKAVFSLLSQTSGRLDAGELLEVGTYTPVTRLVKNLTEEAPLFLQETCVETVRELARLFPHLRIGHSCSIDAQLVGAWARQTSGKYRGEIDLSREAYLRRCCPEAGYRAYGYSDEGREYLDDEGRLQTGGPKPDKDARGYLDLVLTENITGIPLVGMLVDASVLHEPHGVRELLKRLYAFWPDIPLEHLVGDKLYDEREVCKICELEFGIAPVFMRRPSHAKQNVHMFTPAEHKTIKYIDGWGVAHCREHGLPMRLEGVEGPNRVGLLPGQAAPENSVRMRFACTAADPCGRSSIAMSTDWSSLTRLPHHSRSGRPKEVALRQALYGVRNVSESAFANLELAYGQAPMGGSRPRVYDRETLETFRWAGFTTRALLLLHAHRRMYDLYVNHPGYGNTTSQQRRKAA